MMVRLVMQSRKVGDRTVTALVNRGERWSPRSAAEVAADLRSGRIRYEVPWPSGPAEVRALDPDGRDLAALGPNGEPDGLLLLPDG